MKHAIAIFLVLGFLASPVGCLLASCQMAAPTHDCCPKSPSARAGCPYDLLSSAKPGAAPLKWIAMPAASAIGLVAEAFLPSAVISIAPDGSDLHLKNRILRI